MLMVEEIIEYCSKKPEAYIDYPFGDIPICFKLNKKIFAQIYPRKENYKITLKCEPILGDFYRQQYPEIVVRGYHCPPIQQPYWNTVYIDRIPVEVLFNMIDHSYRQVILSFSKKIQKELLEKTNEVINGVNFD
jgi:predicted DNA-binding protein (MmcQ/YjbR family)